MKKRSYSKKIWSVLVVGGIVQLAASSHALAQTGQTHNMENMPGMRDMPEMVKPAKPAKKSQSPAINKKPAKTTAITQLPAKKAAPSDGGKKDAMSGMDHSNMPTKPGDVSSSAPGKPRPQSETGMKVDGGSSSMPAMDHGQMASPAENSQSSIPGAAATMPMDHAAPSTMAHATEKAGTSQAMPGMQMQAMDGMSMGPMQGGSPPSDARDPNAYAEGEKRMAMRGMGMADDALFGRLLVNELEYTRSKGERGQVVSAEAWYGGDYNKAWFKTDAERQNGRLKDVRVEVMWDRVFATHWSSQMGVRRDSGSGPARTWLGAGVRGMAPYWFETEATAYIGSGGDLAARFEARYELLFTQRLILQPKVEANFYSRDDKVRGIGSGLSDLEFSVRLRYEIRRQFAPYIGASWKRKFGNTADMTRQQGESVKNTEVVAGVRLWF